MHALGANALGYEVVFDKNPRATIAYITDVAVLYFMWCQFLSLDYGKK